MELRLKVTSAGSQTLQKLFEIEKEIKAICKKFTTDAIITVNTSANHVIIAFKDGKFPDIKGKFMNDDELILKLKELSETSEPIDFDLMDAVQLKEFAKGAKIKLPAAMKDECKIRELLKSKI